MILWAIINVLVSSMFFVTIRAPLMRAYLIINYVLVVNPSFMWEFFGLAHPKFILGHDMYAVALMYMAAFNTVLGISFIALMRSLPRSKAATRSIVAHRLNDLTHVNRIVWAVMILAAIGVIGKVGLDSLGVLRMGQAVAEGAGGGPLLQVTKVIASFDLLALILLGELRLAQRQPTYLTRMALPGLLAVVLLLAIASGSRAQSLTTLIAAALSYRDVVRRYWYVVYPLAIASVPSIFVLFPLLGFYRLNGYNFAEARQSVKMTGTTTSENLLDVIVTRLNYQEAIARAVNYVELNGPQGGAIYWNNVIGLVPRLIWPDKPEITNDSRELGHLLELVTLNDESTSIGLQVVGESFYEYGWLGLWVAVFQALIFAIIHKNFFRPGLPAAITVYTYACFFILQRDGYFAVVPGLIWLSIGIAFFFAVLASLLSRHRSIQMYRPTENPLMLQRGRRR